MKLKQTSFTIVSLLVIGGLGFGLFRLFTMKPTFPEPQMPTPTVLVAKPQLQTITDYYEFTGTTAAIEEVEVRARVEGYLQKLCFIDGSDVQKGDMLFEIEPEFYQAQRDRAYAVLKSSEAELVRAELDLKRVQEAIKTNAVSQQQVT
ncbi:MAG: efflux RND transporter periplasmic adaptor subunit, partial [Planctomycetota bacterium]